MKTIVNKLNVITLVKGNDLKVLQVTGEAGSALPPHYSSKEVIVNIIKGSAILNVNGEENVLKNGTVFLIPEKQKHELTALTKLKAAIIMPIDAHIEFAK